MNRKFGKTPARDAMVYKFTDVFDASKLPMPPKVFGHHAAVAQYHMLGNDSWGDCVFAGAAHEHYIWSLEGGRARARITTADVLADYAAVTGFAFTEKTDNGTDVAAAAKYRQQTGIRDALNVRHKIDAYVSLEAGNIDQLWLAIWLMGAAGIGIQLPLSALDQSDAHGEGNTGVPWTVPDTVKMAGGHYVPGVGRDADGNILIVTWGKIQAMTPAFFSRFSDEGVAYLNLEILDAKGLSPEGYDASALRNIIAQL
jgi:hypothetical protein